jgi:hypothetical protein
MIDCSTQTGVALVADFKHTQKSEPLHCYNRRLSVRFEFLFRACLLKLSCTMLGLVPAAEQRMAEPVAKRQKTDAATQPHGGCDSLEGAARSCCTACLHKFVKVEPPLSRKEIEKAVKHVAGRTKRWRSSAMNRAPDCCNSLKLLLSAASAATAVAEDSEHVAGLSSEAVRACETACSVCTLELLKYQDAHLGHTR